MEMGLESDSEGESESGRGSVGLRRKTVTDRGNTGNVKNVNGKVGNDCRVGSRTSQVWQKDRKWNQSMETGNDRMLASL